MGSRWLFVTLIALTVCVLAAPNGLTVAIPGCAFAAVAAAMLWERAGSAESTTDAASHTAERQSPLVEGDPDRAHVVLPGDDAAGNGIANHSGEAASDPHSTLGGSR